MQTFNPQNDGDSITPSKIRELPIEGSIELVWAEMLKKSKSDFTRSGWQVYRFLELVEIHAKQKHEVSFYASQLFISIDYLRQVCQKLVNRPPIHCIGLRLVIEAIYMMENQRGLSIEDVSDLLGFQSHSYFSKHFKKYMGSAPRAFLKNRQGQGPDD